MRGDALYASRITDTAAGVLKVDTRTPEAAVAADPTLALTGQPFRFDASASFAPFGAISRYEWDLDGNGSFETDTGQSPLAQAVYPTAGTRVAAVRVTAPSGRTATAAASVEARLAPPAGLLGASIDAGAQFTDSPRVTVRLVWRPFDTGVVISNDGGFAGARTFPIAADIPWTLQSSGSERLPKTIYVRFLNGGTPSDQTYQDEIILDRTAPVVQSAALATPPAAAAGVQRAKARTRAFRIRVAARDNLSGVATV